MSNMRQRRRRRRSNPFEHQQLGDAIKLVEIITSNAKKVLGSRRNPWHPEWDQSILPEFEEDENNPIYTPLNIVSASLNPKVGRKLLRVLMEDADRPENESYKDLFAAMEEDTGSVYALGDPIPDLWVEEKRRGKRTYTQLKRWSEEDFGLDYGRLADDFEIGKRRKLRRKRKQRHRRS